MIGSVTGETAHAVGPAARTVDAREAAERKVRETLDQAYGTVFYGTLLKQLRASSLKGEYMHGGRGEEVFQAQLDQVLVERISDARGFDLGEARIRELVDQQMRVDKIKERFHQTRSAHA
ncbi:MAG: hypothetical protein JSV19_10575 [Phycisphaerales bacterium]|nr:MAG: hypothetical protein JSV19_10575 [Phycisphaerales bacterium]